MEQNKELGKDHIVELDGQHTVELDGQHIVELQTSRRDHTEERHEGGKEHNRTARAWHYQKVRSPNVILARRLGTQSPTRSRR